LIKVGFQRCAAIVDNVSGQGLQKFVDMNGARTKAAWIRQRMDCSRKVSASVEKRHDVNVVIPLREKAGEAIDPDLFAAQARVELFNGQGNAHFARKTRKRDMTTSAEQ
jgi:hypothetical protein